MKNPFAALALCFALIATSAQSQDFANLTPDQEAAFGDAVRAYLLDNPEVIMEAVAVLETRQAEMAQMADSDLVRAHWDALNDDGFSFAGGNPDGDIVVIEFIDYRCGFCRRAHDDIRALVDQNDDVRYVIKEFPILGEASMAASRAALAVLVNDGPDAYWEMNDALMMHTGEITEAALRVLATDSGADPDAMLETMNSQIITQMVAQNHALARQMGLSGTPSFIFGDMIVRGAIGFDVMQSLVDDLRADL